MSNLPRGAADKIWKRFSSQAQTQPKGETFRPENRKMTAPAKEEIQREENPNKNGHKLFHTFILPFENADFLLQSR